MLAATFAMAGATFGVFLKTKSSNMKQLSLSVAISAILGITEPAMYGVVLKLKRPFYAAMVGGGLVGMFFNLIDLKAFGMAIPGLIALPGYVDVANSQNILLFSNSLIFIVYSSITIQHKYTYF